YRIRKFFRLRPVKPCVVKPAYDKNVVRVVVGTEARRGKVKGVVVEANERRYLVSRRAELQDVLRCAEAVWPGLERNIQCVPASPHSPFGRRTEYQISSSSGLFANPTFRGSPLRVKKSTCSSDVMTGCSSLTSVLMAGPRLICDSWPRNNCVAETTNTQANTNRKNNISCNTLL